MWKPETHTQTPDPTPPHFQTKVTPMYEVWELYLIVGHSTKRASAVDIPEKLLKQIDTMLRIWLLSLFIRLN